MQDGRDDPGVAEQGPAATVKGLEGVHNFREINELSVEDQSNFTLAKVASVIRLGRVSDGIMKMLGGANEAIGQSSLVINDAKTCKNFVERVPIVLHPSLERSVKLNFLRDIGGLAHH